MTEFDGLPMLRSPVAVVAFEGWNDAADASTAAVEHLEQVWDARKVTELDPEEFYDFQVSRPTVTMTEGETRSIEWPSTKFMVASPPDAERDVVLIRGIEPSMRWRTFCEQILEVCHSMEITKVVLLGALLADVPYSRPLPISGGATESGAAERYKLVPTRYDGPTGIVGVLHDAATRADLEAVSFWVHVPHYANNPPCPKATLALLHRIEDVLDIPVPTADLEEETAEWEERVRAAAEQDAELGEYVRELEERSQDAGIQPLSGDEIAKEFEKYLRRRGGSTGPTAGSW
ncbi:putative ATP-grasp superfamily ATP-dependent carboligase [Catenuloplanes nepalensis]|uniref:ATP-grasp superfamily ATP-dependent carboligase n=1 Tax=Catenuloplanes nepalensis TaxID=587533 RepID=A0ABT9MWA0_9ACTN|nr:PAC2 family protein [Catenuloplanes nepalensis]MDP9795722.1 putative ATP-grasp superfamily ATP-dependent carboligase [Catenuloplanes nepalensis]